MAEETLRDVVEQAQSVGDLSPPDVSATTTKTRATEGNESVGVLAEDKLRPQTTTQPQLSEEFDNAQSNGVLTDRIKKVSEKHAAFVPLGLTLDVLAA
jgi:hypothetical protein